MFDESDVEVFKALSEENRLHIISMLQKQNMCGCHLLKSLNITQPTLSHHMRQLLDANLVEQVKVGNCVNYQLNKKTFLRLEKWIQTITRKE